MPPNRCTGRVIRLNCSSNTEKRYKFSVNRGKKEELFTRSMQNLHTLLQRIGRVNLHSLQKFKERMSKVGGNKKKLLKAEIAGEEENLRIEKARSPWKISLENTSFFVSTREYQGVSEKTLIKNALLLGMFTEFLDRIGVLDLGNLKATISMTSARILAAVSRLPGSPIWVLYGAS